MKSSGPSAKDDYNKGRINGSVFIDIDTLSDQSSSLPHMLPSVNQFSEHIGNVCWRLSCTRTCVVCTCVVCTCVYWCTLKLYIV